MRFFSCLSLFALAACASPSEPSKSLTLGDATVESRLEGSRIVTTVSAARSDEKLTIQYDRAKREALFVPKYGPSKMIKNVELSDDLGEVNERIGEPASAGLSEASALRTGTGGIKPQTVKPAPPACTNPCVEKCKSKFSDPLQQEACSFGCNVGCGS
jgi:hypothetical protein